MSTPVMDDAAILDAGGIASGTDPRGRAAADVVTARAYRHDALEADRVVVCLVPDNLGPAEDLAMEFLGFALADDPRPVGVGARRALGFPAWALINDPGNGRHALAMVKDMERLARLAKTKPGNAKDGYDQLALRLDRAAPHFLPTFWEQAGRAFIEAENQKTAGICFGKARDAERVHALPIDEVRLADVYVEYALAGALPAKALAQYARDVAARLPADEAYHQVRSVAVHRVAGGLGPHVGMAEDLNRLAKAAGRRPDVEAEGLLAELLALPAVAKAAFGFWKSYSKALMSLAAKDPEARGRLLGIVPDPPGWRSDLSDEWIALLAATGADAGLTGDAQEAAAPPGGAISWLERFTARRARSYGSRRCAGLIALVERMVPKLLAEGRELDVSGDRWWRVDLDVLDVLIAGGVPVALGDAQRLDVASWLQDESPGQRDLAALASHPGLAHAWRQGVRDALTHHRFRGPHGKASEPASPAHIARLHSRPALRAALASWLEEAADHSAHATIATLADLIDQIGPLHSAPGAAVAPAAVRRLADADVAAALARTLRAGLPEELAWSAYDKALSKLSKKDALYYDGAWPYLIVNDGTRAVVVGPDGVQAEHVLRVPADARRFGWWSRPACAYVDGRLFVSWRDNTGTHAYWSDRAGEVFDIKHGEARLPPGRVATTVPLPGGGVTSGGRPWHAGDHTSPARHAVATDGTNTWRLEADERAGAGQTWRWREFDPASGAGGRHSRPRFFEDGGDAIVDQDCVLLTAPGLTDSPLGQAGALVGWRVRTELDASVTGEGIDGRRVHLRPPNGERLIAAVSVPGAEQPRPLTMEPSHLSWPLLALCEPSSGQPAARVRAGRAVPPPDWWHWMRPRDDAGSRVLRGVTDKDAARLVAAVSASREDEAFAQAAKAVRAMLSGVRDDQLREAVAHAVVNAVEVARWLATFRGYAEAPPPVESTRPAVDDGVLASAVAGLLRSPGRYFGGGASAGTSDVLEAVAATADALHRRQSAAELRTVTLDWPLLLGLEGALAMRAVSPAFEEPERAAVLGLLDALGRGGLVGHPGTLRVLKLSGPEGRTPDLATVLHQDRHGALVVTHGLALIFGANRTAEVRAVERNDRGRFGPVPGLSIEEDRRPAGWGEPGRIRRLVELATLHGPVPWRPELVDDLVARTGMTRGEAALLLAGLPGVASWEANFLPAPTRTMLGLSAAEARTARDALRDLPADRLATLLAAAMPDDPAQLWDAGPDLDGIASAWTAMFGQRVAVAEDVLAKANRVIPGRDGVEIVRGLANPISCAWMNPGALNEAKLPGIAVALPWLAYRLPSGDPLHAALPVAHQRILAAMSDKAFTIDLGYHTATVPALAAIEVVEKHSDMVRYRLVPARLEGPRDPALAMFSLHSVARAVSGLLAPDLAALLSAHGGPTPAGRYPHDPRESVPDLVDEVARRNGLSTDAAGYYLQLLALPDPSDRHVTRWTGWSADAVAKLRAELAAAGLVVEAKRDRAGRTAFLPGGWLPLKSPDLPVEAWKADMYGLEDDGRPPLGVMAITRPVSDLFHLAWRRVVDGDEPRLRSLGESR